MFGQPFAPLALGGHASIDRQDSEAHDSDSERHEQQRLMQHRCAVLLLEGIENVAVPDVQAELGRKLEKNKQDVADRQQPGKTPRGSYPELPCGRPKALRQGLPRGYLLKLLNHSVPGWMAIMLARLPRALAIRAK